MRKILFLLLLCVPLGLSAEQNDLHIIETKVAERVPFAQPFALQYVLAHNPDGQVSLDEQSIPSDFALTKTHILDDLDYLDSLSSWMRAESASRRARFFSSFSLSP